jgi:DNA-binding beta-propeller fold protein YncE
MWFTENNGNKIRRITLLGEIKETALSTPGSVPIGIAAGPDGNVWFTVFIGDRIGRITASGAVTEFGLPAGGSPYGIAAGPDGNMWFANSSTIGRITTGVSAADRRLGLYGSGQVGLPLVCGADVWGPNSEVGVSWQRAGATIPGQSGLAYTPTAGDLGASITCTSHGRPSAMLATMTAVSNPITIVAQLTGPTGPAGPPGRDGVLAAVWAPGAKSVKAGKKLKVQYAVTNAASLQAKLSGKKKLTKKVKAKALSKNLRAKAGTNTLKWKMPKALKPGKYTLKLYYQGTVKATTKVKIRK